MTSLEKIQAIKAIAEEYYHRDKSKSYYALGKILEVLGEIIPRKKVSK